METEIIEARTKNSRKILKSPHKYRLETSMGAIHYDPADWKPIENEIVNGVMDHADYQMNLLQANFDGGKIIRFSSAGESIDLQPMELDWINDIDQVQQIAVPQAVPAIITNPIIPILSNPTHKEGTITYEGAYGAGTSIAWSLQTADLAKILTINNLSDLAAPSQHIIDGGNACLLLNFIFDPSENMGIYVDNVFWDKSTKVQTFNFIEFRKAGETLFGFKPLSFWDSDHNTGRSIATLEQAEGNLFIEIRVPYTWLQTAIFPVMIDADIDLTTSNDNKDCTERLNNYTLFVIVGATYTSWGRYNSGDKQWNGGLCFPLSIPQGDTIDACTFTCNSEREVTRDASHVCNARIWAEDANDLADFTGISQATYQSRYGNATSAVVDWDGVPGAGLSGEFTSVDFSEVLQERIDDSGWESGDNFVFFVSDLADRSTGDGGGTPLIAGLTFAKDYSTSTTQCMRLAVDYSEGGWSNIDGINNISSASISKVNNVAVAGISKVHGVSV